MKRINVIIWSIMTLSIVLLRACVGLLFFFLFYLLSREQSLIENSPFRVIFLPNANQFSDIPGERALFKRAVLLFFLSLFNRAYV